MSSKYDHFYLLRDADSFVTKDNFMVHCHKLEDLVK